MTPPLLEAFKKNRTSQKKNCLRCIESEYHIKNIVTTIGGCGQAQLGRRQTAKKIEGFEIFRGMVQPQGQEQAKPFMQFWSKLALRFLINQRHKG